MWSCLRDIWDKKEKEKDYPLLIHLVEMSLNSCSKSNSEFDQIYLMKTPHKRRWFISCFSFKLMDMVAFKASINSQWSLDSFKMQAMTIGQNVYYNLWYMSCEWRWHIVNNHRCNQLCCNRGQWFLKIEGLL
jgi:hypothetical protein